MLKIETTKLKFKTNNHFTLYKYLLKLIITKPDQDKNRHVK